MTITCTLVASCGRIHVEATGEPGAWQIRLANVERRPLPLSRLIGHEERALRDRLDTLGSTPLRGPTVAGYRPLHAEVMS